MQNLRCWFGFHLFTTWRLWGGHVWERTCERCGKEAYLFEHKRILVTLQCTVCERNLEFDDHVMVNLTTDPASAECCCDGCAGEDNEDDDPA